MRNIIRTAVALIASAVLTASPALADNPASGSTTAGSTTVTQATQAAKAAVDSCKSDACVAAAAIEVRKAKDAAAQVFATWDATTCDPDACKARDEVRLATYRQFSYVAGQLKKLATTEELQVLVEKFTGLEDSFGDLEARVAELEENQRLVELQEFYEARNAPDASHAWLDGLAAGLMWDCGGVVDVYPNSSRLPSLRPNDIPNDVASALRARLLSEQPDIESGVRDPNGLASDLLRTRTALSPAPVPDLGVSDALVGCKVDEQVDFVDGKGWTCVSVKERTDLIATMMGEKMTNMSGEDVGLLNAQLSVIGVTHQNLGPTSGSQIREATPAMVRYTFPNRCEQIMESSDYNDRRLAALESDVEGLKAESKADKNWTIGFTFEVSGFAGGAAWNDEFALLLEKGEAEEEFLGGRYGVNALAGAMFELRRFGVNATAGISWNAPNGSFGVRAGGDLYGLIGPRKRFGLGVGASFHDRQVDSKGGFYSGIERSTFVGVMAKYRLFDKPDKKAKAQFLVNLIARAGIALESVSYQVVDARTLSQDNRPMPLFELGFQIVERKYRE